MILIGDIPILVSVQTILSELNIQLKIQGKQGFNNIRIAGDSYICSCPFHEDKKPSFSILLQNKGDKQAGIWNCFSCKRSGSLSKLVSMLLFDTDSTILGQNWLIKSFADYEVENRDKAFKIPTRISPNKIEKQYVSEEELDKYAYFHPYFEKRHLTNDIVMWYDIGYDKETNSMTMPVYNTEGKVEFIVRRSIDKKRFGMPKGIDKILYGVYQMNKLFPNTNYCYITESIMNCLTLVGHFHVPAIALLGTGSSYQYELLKNLPIRRYIIALDNDLAGNKGKDKLIKELKGCKILSVLETPENGLDINDCWNDKKLLDKIINV